MRRWLAVVLVASALVPPPPARAEGLTVAQVRLVDALPPSPSVRDRLAEIRRRIQEALVYPELARKREQTGEVRVRFAIDREGHARDVATVGSSGRWLLDRAAARAVAAAAPLPWVWGQLEVPVRFELNENDLGR